jgi:hypothetical protein
MLKKLIASLLALLILTTFSVSAYAGQTGGGISLQPAGLGTPQSTTGSPIKSTTGSALNDMTGSPVKGTTGSAFKDMTPSAVFSEENITSESAISDKEAGKPGFEEVFIDALKDGAAVDNDYLIMNITNPQKDKESTVYKSYVLSGNSKYDDVIISIAKFNEDTGEYEPMKNTDGEYSWEIGEYRLFSKEIILTEGSNKIKMMAYRTSQKEEALRKNIQVNCFTISLLNESIFTRAKNTFINAVEEIVGK